MRNNYSSSLEIHHYLFQDIYEHYRSGTIEGDINKLTDLISNLLKKKDPP